MKMLPPFFYVFLPLRIHFLGLNRWPNSFDLADNIKQVRYHVVDKSVAIIGKISVVSFTTNLISADTEQFPNDFPMIFQLLVVVGNWWHLSCELGFKGNQHAT